MGSGYITRCRRRGSGGGRKSQRGGHQSPAHRPPELPAVVRQRPRRHRPSPAVRTRQGRRVAHRGQAVSHPPSLARAGGPRWPSRKGPRVGPRARPTARPSTGHRRPICGAGTSRSTSATRLRGWAGDRPRRVIRRLCSACPPPPWPSSPAAPGRTKGQSRGIGHWPVPHQRAWAHRQRRR